jgi:hypothetical protein
MVGFRDLVGTGIAPVSKKTAVNKIFCIFRAGFVYSLNVAADFADAIGESAGSAYRSKANEILESAKAHYGKFGDYIYNCDVRPEDGSTIHSIATFGNYLDL